MSPNDLFTAKELSEKMMRGIQNDFMVGIFEPNQITCFSDLHDFVDANSYGGLFNPDCPFDVSSDRDMAIINEAQNMVDIELRKGDLQQMFQ